MKENTKNNSVAKGVAVGAGLAVLTAAAAGAYFLYGSKNAKKNRKQVKSWSLKAKGEILERLENLSEVNQAVYESIVKEVTDKYQTLKNLTPEDAIEFAGELKNYWTHISKEIGLESSKNHSVKKVRKSKKS